MDGIFGVVNGALPNKVSCKSWHIFWYLVSEWRNRSGSAGIFDTRLEIYSTDPFFLSLHSIFVFMVCQPLRSFVREEISLRLNEICGVC